MMRSSNLCPFQASYNHKILVMLHIFPVLLRSRRMSQKILPSHGFQEKFYSAQSIEDSRCYEFSKGETFSGS